MWRGNSIILKKQGFLRIVEASIAILLITGVVLYVISQRGSGNVKLDSKIFEIEDTVLKEISRNADYSDKIVAYNITNPSADDKYFLEQLENDVVKQKIPQGFSFALNICELNSACPLPTTYPAENVEIYSRSTPIAATLEKYSPKQLRIFIWKA